MSEMMNFLDLPFDEMEEVFSYCSGSLLDLTETNSFIKNVIESSSRLMDHICLNVNINRKYKISIEQQEIMKAVLSSSRRYKSIKLVAMNLESGNEDSALANNNVQENELKHLFDKNAESLKKVIISMVVQLLRNDDVIEIFSLLQNLLNVEKIKLLIHEFHKTPDENFNNNAAAVSSIQSPSHKFSKLKSLDICEIHLSFLSALDFFQGCETIKTLSVRTSKLKVDLSAFRSILINSRKTLEDLIVKSNFDAGEEKIKYAEFLTELETANLNLKFLDLELPDFLHFNIEDIVRLKDFIISQSRKKLRSLRLHSTYFTRQLFNAIKDFLASDLKVLRIEECDFKSEDLNEDQILYQPWNLNKLEILKIEGTSESGDAKYVRAILQSSSDKLKEMELSSLDLSLNILENITRNYTNLTRLSVAFCSNHAGDDIFLILKHLKKLKTLIYDFPDDSESESVLNTDLFLNEDYVLPEIHKVHFLFNKSVDNFNVMRFMQLLKNISILSLDGSAWKHFNNDTLYICTRELPDLKEFSIVKSRRIEDSALKTMKINVQQFNKNPYNFRFCGKKIDAWMQEYQQ